MVNTLYRHSFLLLVFTAVTFTASASKEVSNNHSAIIDIPVQALEKLERANFENDENIEVVEGAPAHYDFRDDYLSADNKFYVGYSQHAVMTVELKDWPMDEFMYFIEGQVEITDEHGNTKIYGPGDMLLMPKGFSGTWRQLGLIKKINIMYTP